MEECFFFFEQTNEICLSCFVFINEYFRFERYNLTKQKVLICPIKVQRTEII